MLASMRGHEVVVEALLKAGATVDMQDKVHFISCSLPHTSTQCIWNTEVVVVMAQEKPPEDTVRTGTVTITASPYPHCLQTILVRGGTI